MTTAGRILEELERRGPLKDSELAAILAVAHQQVNQAARGLVSRGAITRAPADDGILRNTLVERPPDHTAVPVLSAASAARTSSSAAWRASLASLGPRVPGASVSRSHLAQLGFMEHELEILGPSDALGTGDGLSWNTLGPLPTGPGLYCFVAMEHVSAAPRVMYVGLSSQLSAIAAGTDPLGARGGQRYGRPKYAGMTRKRINAEVARLVRDGLFVTHWFSMLSVPDDQEPRAFLHRAEEALILRWNLRVVGWNRG